MMGPTQHQGSMGAWLLLHSEPLQVVAVPRSFLQPSTLLSMPTSARDLIQKPCRIKSQHEALLFPNTVCQGIEVFCCTGVHLRSENSYTLHCEGVFCDDSVKFLLNVFSTRKNRSGFLALFFFTVLLQMCGNPEVWCCGGSCRLEILSTLWETWSVTGVMRQEHSRTLHFCQMKLSPTRWCKQINHLAKHFLPDQ